MDAVHLLPQRYLDFITPFLKQLHWLPVSYRITYKLSLTIQKAIHHNSHDYLSSLLHLHTHYYTHRPVPPTSLSLPLPIFTNSILKIYAPLLSLPLTTGTSYPNTYELNLSIPSFKRHLMTHYFSLPSPHSIISLPRIDL